MKISELITMLQAMPQDLEVYGYCNHSQTPEKISSPHIVFTNELSYSLYDYEWSTSQKDAEEAGYDKQAVIL